MKPPWRNGLACWTSNSKVVGSSPTGGGVFLLSQTLSSFYCWSRKSAGQSVFSLWTLWTCVLIELLLSAKFTPKWRISNTFFGLFVFLFWRRCRCFKKIVWNFVSILVGIWFNLLCFVFLFSSFSNSFLNRTTYLLKTRKRSSDKSKRQVFSSVYRNYNPLGMLGETQ